ncbi:MAG: hypothetical protein IT537_08590 [Hyphomicrobiales bacterium]|nr:hypothetical protein [Hyphomicrobiales bacterium]
MLIRNPDYLFVAFGAAIIGGAVVAIVSTARKGAVCHVLTLAALMVVLLVVLVNCANYPGLTDRCVPLYGGTLVTLPHQGYRMPDGGWIPMSEILVMSDGGVWKCT